MLYSIFKAEFIDNSEENHSYVHSASQVGNLRPISLDGTENKYYIVKALDHSEKSPELTVKPPRQEEEETLEAYVARVRPIALQAFADVQAGLLEALVVDLQQLRLLKESPEFKTTEGEI